ncbi:MAG: hypothetical protein WD557_01200 [Dehalococcoidia bacterium]
MDVRARLSMESVAVTFLLGVGIRLLIDWANHHGPSGDGWSLQGNGALVFALLIPVVLIGAELVAALRKKWVDMPLLPLALALGMVAGGVLGV